MNNDQRAKCQAHVIYDGEPLDCALPAGHRMPHEAERSGGDTFEWGSEGNTGRAS